MPDWLLPGLLLLLGYLSGSVSYSYLLGRHRDAIDLRARGSGKLSASNVYNYYGVAGMIAVGILDVAKAALPVLLARRLGQPLLVCGLVGLAAMAGHNWSLFLGLRGGRGVATALGILLNLFSPGVIWMLGHLAAGRLVPPAAAAVGLVGFLTLPLFAAFRHQPEVVVLTCWGIALLTVLKRLEGSHKMLADPGPWWRVLLCRLVLDRDIANYDTWISDEPPAGAAAQ